MARGLSPQQKRDETRVSRLYGQRCSGVQIPIMETCKVMSIGLQALRAGLDDTAIGDRIAAYVQTIRTN